jgi:putative membrane protein
MNPLLWFAISVFVTAISLVLISRISVLGVEIDHFQSALISGVVFGLLNWLVSFFYWFVKLPLVAILTLGLSLVTAFILNVIVFSLTAKLVEGFRLRNGLVSAIFGSIALGLVNGVLFWILGLLGIIQY